MNKKIVIALVMLVGISLFTQAQNPTETETKTEKKSKIGLNIAFKNRHLWRCGQSINGFSAQSTLSYNLPFLTVGAWGAYELNAGSYSEVDIFVEGHFLKYFTLGVYDFYNPVDAGGRSYKDFSDIKNSPNHVIDVFLKYKGTESLPLGGLIATYVYGNDKDDKGDQRYSTYLELNYTLTLTKKSDIFFYLGATTSKESAYAARKTIMWKGASKKVPVSDKDFNIIGLGSKYTRNFKVGKFDSSVFGEFLYNPNVDAVYMAFGISSNF